MVWRVLREKKAYMLTSWSNCGVQTRLGEKIDDLVIYIDKEISFVLSISYAGMQKKLIHACGFEIWIKAPNLLGTYKVY